MSEISSAMKLGVTLLIIASVIITSFCILTVTNTFTRDYYQEQYQAIDRTQGELRDLVNEDLPLLAIDRAISASSYYNSTVYCYCTTTSYNNGVKTTTTNNAPVLWGNDVLPKNTGRTGTIRNVSYVPNANVLYLTLEIGG